MNSHLVNTSWSKADLLRIPLLLTEQLCIPAESRLYLADVGIPRRIEDWINFEPGSDFLSRLPGPDALILIGRNEGNPVCINESDGGSIVIVDQSNRTKRTFMNSTVEAFVQCGGWFKGYRESVTGWPEADLLKFVREMEDRMKAIDRRAFTSEHHFWPLVFEEIRLGFM